MDFMNKGQNKYKSCITPDNALAKGEPFLLSARLHTCWIPAESATRLTKIKFRAGSCVAGGSTPSRRALQICTTTDEPVEEGGGRPGEKNNFYLQEGPT